MGCAVFLYERLATYTMEQLATLNQCMIRDRHKLRRRIAQAKTPEQRKTVSNAVATSMKQAQQRLQNKLAVSYPKNLPISARADELTELIKQHQVVVVAGETGSGKSTQLPKLCLAAGQGTFGQIAHTQPRRIAARSISERLAQELNCEVGKGVGFRVRFSEKCSDQDYIKVLTDGMLLSESDSDRFLTQYDTIIVDEAHERSLNIDLLLGFLKQLLKKRSDLKLIITSATIDTERFSKHFDNATVVTVSGRTYPVELIYQAPENEKERSDKETNQAILRAIETLFQTKVGNTLVFLPGEREIREVMYFLGKHLKRGIEILPLYARLPAKEQAILFRPSGAPRIILSTNVAETSLTLPGIDYVVDTGYARVSRYHASRRVNALPIERISQAASNQRMGRCGRVKNGRCIRLFSEEDFDSAPEYTSPEIKRTSLSGVLLTLLSRGLGEIAHFPFIDAPERRQINGAKQELQYLGALDEQGSLTPIGKDLSRMQVDPRIGRILWAAANEQDCLQSAIVLAAALEIADPRLVPFEKMEAARQHHKQMGGDGSDFMALLSLWDTLQTQQQELSRNKFNKWCERNYLSIPRIREWGDLVKRLTADLKPGKSKHTKGTANNEDAIHKALLTGLIDQVAMKGDKGDYQGTFAKQCAIFPGSQMFKAAPKWIVAAELVETGRLYARMVAPIKTQWIEELAPHLLRREYSEPTWSAKAGQVMAFERAYLMSLPIYSARRTPYSKINPIESRMLFIRDGLVGNDLEKPPAFLEYNQQVIDSVIKMEHKLRRHDVLVAPDALYAFYHALLPAKVFGQASLQKWLKTASDAEQAALLMDEQQVMKRELSMELQQSLPDAIEIRGNRIDLNYQFKPGEFDDGITAKFPLPLLNQLTPADFDRLVPCYLPQKLELLIRSLPKPLRKLCVPIAETVKRVQAEVERDARVLEEALADALSIALKIKVSATDFDVSSVDNNLKIKLAVVDEEGDEIETADSLQQLQQRYGGEAKQQIARVDHQIVQSGKTQWDFGALPKSIEVLQQGAVTTAYPALVDNVESVGVQLFDSAVEAAGFHQQGLVRLFCLSHPVGLGLAKKPLAYWKNIALRYVGIGNSDELKQEIVDALLLEAFKSTAENIRDKKSYAASADTVAKQWIADSEQYCALLEKVLTQASKVRVAFDDLKGKLNSTIATDIEMQLGFLVYESFVSEVRYQQLLWYPKFLKGCLVRLERCQFDVSGDLAKLAQLQPYWGRYLDSYEAHSESATLDEYRWLVEVFRLSLFAQTVGLPVKVSPKRLEQAWQVFQSEVE
ncbi:MAG: ATP-dependent helicase HrpA [Parvicella sp.]|jgi:ATP-dependent helicase HrpA